MKLINPCKYSFQDLMIAAKECPNLGHIKQMSQQERNKEVRRLCEKAHWYFQDVKGTDGIIYTAFSPEID